MNRVAFLRSLVFAAAAPTAFAACGGSSDTATGSTNTAQGAGGTNAGSGTAGSGTAGSGTAGSGTAGSGAAGSGTAGTGTSGSGTAGSGTAGTGTSGSGTAGTGTAGKGASGAGPAGAGGGGGKSKFGCDDPKPVLVDGKDTGVETCADGTLHKKAAIECPKAPPKVDACMPAGTCQFDTECTAMPNGYCGAQTDFGGFQCACQYGCTKDSDCGVGSVCLCGDPVGTCVPGGCTSDADCKDGNLCTTYDQSMGCGFLHAQCRTGADECGGDLDCKAQGPNVYCTPDQLTGVRHCMPGGCAIGRPMIVEAALVVAALTSGGDWA